MPKKTQKRPSLKKHLSVKSSDYGLIGLFKENKGFLTITKDLTTKFLKYFPTEKDAHFFTHTYSYRLRTFLTFFNSYNDLYEFLDIRLGSLDDLIHHFHILSNPDLNRKAEKFKENLERLEKKLIRTDPQITERLKLISKKECFRLYEAMKCLKTSCNYAAVVMAVSAVENRLHKLLKDANSRLYKQEFEKTTLGGIIELFRRDTRYRDPKYDKFKKILPEKHKPLMEILNTYRIFSAHPMEERISCQTAKIIVQFSFLLLIDESLKSKKPEN